MERLLLGRNLEIEFSEDEMNEVMRLYQLSQYQRAVGGLTFRQVAKEPVDWIDFTITAINVEKQIKNGKPN